MPSRLPDLTFPMVNFGQNEANWDLRPLLYRGGAALRIHTHGIDDALSHLPLERTRLPLVARLHDAITSTLVSGASRHTVKRQIQNIRRFYAWMDRSGLSPVADNVESHFIAWTDFLYQRKVQTRKILPGSAHMAASSVAAVLDSAMERQIAIIKKTRLSGIASRRHHSSAQKLNLESAFVFGSVLYDITECLDAPTIYGPLPVRLKLRNGSELEEWSSLAPVQNLRTLQKRRSSKSQVLRARAAWEADRTWRTRYPLINLRIEAELLIFIAQTGMNLAQAYQLRSGRFSFQRTAGGHLVRRVYKNRRQGEVEFTIYSSYRPLLERYLQWRGEIFPDDPTGLLFPQRGHVTRSRDVALTFRGIRRVCEKLGIPFIGARQLRHTRVNWLIRRSGDPALSADMGQHAEATLLRNYDEPHHQVAVAELGAFFRSDDIFMLASGPGACAGPDPRQVAGTPQGAPPADCISPAGCLFCANQRDIDSLDHVWSLVSYRYLKSLELALYRRSNPELPSPAHLVIERVTQKLAAFMGRSSERGAWVREAEARVVESYFHPRWDGFIQLAEKRQ